ncbi:MAG: hypothetical protein CME40_13795 [Haliea sp.]|nr:hypothetical protein [Haliea sp.]|tara:strand:- start:77571 stop:78494 length:924 start_codon:yes stop_codon:yes gene_type:complete
MNLPDWSRRLAIPLAVMMLATAATAATAANCPDRAAVAAHVAALAQGRPGPGFGFQLEAGQVDCARAALVQALPRVLGQPVGYKAAFTGEAVQRRFGMQGPAWGVMFDRHLLPSGTSLPAAFGAVPRYEPDLLVEVGSARLADAATPAEALDALRAIIPFIELPDLVLEGPANGYAIAAINTGFRGGVLGAPIAVAGHREPLLAALADMRVVVRDAARDQALGQAAGESLMGHPLNAAIWLARALREAGIELRPGDLLSLGGFLPPARPEPGLQLEVHYRGLPGDPRVAVRFTGRGTPGSAEPGPES